jgi:hypothetical protein
VVGGTGGSERVDLDDTCVPDGHLPVLAFQGRNMWADLHASCEKRSFWTHVAETARLVT